MKVDLTEFSDELDMETEEMGGNKDTSEGFVLSK